MQSRVRELREAQGWSQGELAERLAVSRQTVNAIETGKYDPSLPLAFRIAACRLHTATHDSRPRGQSPREPSDDVPQSPPAVRDRADRRRVRLPILPRTSRGGS